MLYYNIVSLFTNVATFVISLLPNSDPSIVSAIGSEVATFRNYIVVANWFFPVDNTLLLLSFWLVIEAAILLWKIVRWVGSIFTFGIIK